MRWIVRAIKAIGVGVVIAWFAAGSALLVAMFGKCETAEFVANLAPNGLGWTHDQIAGAIMKACLAGCEPKVTVTVTRYCHDEKYIGFRYYEEGMLVDMHIDTRGLSINSLKVNLVPGVITGVPALHPASPPELPALSYAVVMDPRVNTLVRGEAYQSGDTTGVDYTSIQGEKIPSSGDLHIPIRYYALDSRSDVRDSPITCARSSEITRVTYAINTGPGVEYPKSPVVETSLVTWDQLKAVENGSPYFDNQRSTAADQIHKQARVLTAQNNQRGWRYWPETFPDKEPSYKTELFDVCKDQQASLCKLAQ